MRATPTVLAIGLAGAIAWAAFMLGVPDSFSIDDFVAPELRSPNPEKRHAGLENLETLAALSQELSNLLFLRALRGIVPRS